MSYAQPTLTGFSGEGVENAKTVGGQKLVIEGRNFGPQGEASALEGVVSTDAMGVRRAADGCRVTEAHVEIECLTPSGIGEARWAGR